MTRWIVCRARLGDQACYHGRREDPEQPMDDDGTWDGRSVICDACYVALMPFTRSSQALADELPGAIAHYRDQLAFVREHDDVPALIEQAEEELSNAATPRWLSAGACLRMAQRELMRREVT
jgi:hypothetical protein